jgi:hypothetical protein
MKSWGPGFFERDWACDFANIFVYALLTDINEALSRSDASLWDLEYTVMPRVAVCALMSEQDGLSSTISKGTCQRWQASALQIFDTSADAGILFHEKRRTAIIAAFTRLTKCAGSSTCGDCLARDVANGAEDPPAWRHNWKKPFMWRNPSRPLPPPPDDVAAVASRIEYWGAGICENDAALASFGVLTRQLAYGVATVFAHHSLNYRDIDAEVMPRLGVLLAIATKLGRLLWISPDIIVYWRDQVLPFYEADCACWNDASDHERYREVEMIFRQLDTLAAKRQRQALPVAV